MAFSFSFFFPESVPTVPLMKYIEKKNKKQISNLVLSFKILAFMYFCSCLCHLSIVSLIVDIASTFIHFNIHILLMLLFIVYREKKMTSACSVDFMELLAWLLLRVKS